MVNSSQLEQADSATSIAHHLRQAATKQRALVGELDWSNDDSAEESNLALLLSSAAAMLEEKYKEVIRLQSLVENASHDYTCYAGKLAIAKCTCWKGEAS